MNESKNNEESHGYAEFTLQHCNKEEKLVLISKLKLEHLIFLASEEGRRNGLEEAAVIAEKSEALQGRMLNSEYGKQIAQAIRDRAKEET